MIKIKNLSKKYKPLFIKAIAMFITIGIGNAVLDIVLYALFNYVLSIPVILSQVISYTLAAMNRFYINKFIKYRKNIYGKIIHIQLFRFISVSILVLGISSSIMSVLYGFFEFSPLASKIAVTILNMGLNAASYKFVIFREDEYDEKHKNLKS